MLPGYRLISRERLLQPELTNKQRTIEGGKYIKVLSFGRKYTDNREPFPFKAFCFRAYLLAPFSWLASDGGHTEAGVRPQARPLRGGSVAGGPGKSGG